MTTPPQEPEPDVPGENPDDDQPGGHPTRAVDVLPLVDKEIA